VSGRAFFYPLHKLIKMCAKISVLVFCISFGYLLSNGLGVATARTELHSKATE